MRRLITMAMGIVAAGVLAAACSAVQLPQPGGGSHQYHIESMDQAWATAPTIPPPGANVPGCTLDATHPYPIVLVAGTTENQANNWGALAPMLANAGYCVYTFNYGQITPVVGLYGMGDIGQSAQQLSAEVNKVLAETGASKVDIIGHSQGGMMPRYYLKFLGGASKVHMLIGLTPSNHGTTANGLSLLGRLDVIGTDLIGPALAEQEAGSAFLLNLNAGGDTVPGPIYAVISTIHDEIVTPFTSAFLTGPNVIANMTVQSQCPLDPVGHLGIAYDTPALTDTLNLLQKEENPSATPIPVSCNLADYGPGI